MSLHAFRDHAEPTLWGPTHWESRLLAGSLRGVAATLLHGGDAASRDGLLRHGVLPLLGRRIEDQPERGPSGRVLPFPDRRGAGPKRGASPELVLLLDEWSAIPLMPLAERMALARSTAQPAPEGSCRLLLVLQGFENALDIAAKSMHPDPFWRELSAAAGEEPSGVHLLLATDDASTPALRWLAHDLKGLGEHALRLDDAPSITTPQLASVPGLANARPEAPLSDEDWLQGVDAALRRVVASARRGEAAPEAPPVILAPEPEPLPIRQDLPAVPPPAKPRLRFAAPALGLVVVAGLVAVWQLRSADAPAVVRQTATPPATLPPMAVQPSAQPSAQPLAQKPTPAPASQPRTNTEPGRALLQALAPLPTLDLRSGAAQVAAQLAIQGPPLLALVRYDALQNLPDTGKLRSLRVVAPLFIEPIQVWVRRDSSLTRLQDLREASRIDTGLDGGDALSAAGLRQALSGERRAAMAKPRQLPDETAIAALLRGEVDAVLRTRASALTEAAAADPALRLLSLDRDDAAATRVAQDYLPISSRVSQGRPLPGVMSFLVVRGGDSAAGDRLAAQAMRALCAAALPGLRPDVALPAGRPYAQGATQAATTCSTPTRPPGDSS